MSREAGSLECVTTCDNASRDRERVRPVAFASTMSRDYDRKYHAKAMLMTHSAAAANPGPLRPQWLATLPRPGPNATPAFVAADRRPSPVARSHVRRAPAPDA